MRNAEEAKELEALIETKTKGIDIGILVNNVGIIYWGPYHKIPLEKLFNVRNVNCAT